MADLMRVFAAQVMKGDSIDYFGETAAKDAVNCPNGLVCLTFPKSGDHYYPSSAEFLVQRDGDVQAERTHDATGIPSAREIAKRGKVTEHDDTDGGGTREW